MNKLNIEVKFDKSAFHAPSGLKKSVWWIYLSCGEFDTYRECIYTSPTRPTSRQLRKVVKDFLSNKQG